MESSAEAFKKGLDKAFSQIPLNQSTLGDHMKYKQGFTEENLEGGMADKKTVEDIAKKHKVDIKVLTSGEVDTYKRELKFQIVNQK